MRLLVVSNYYPPYEIGGYELGCRDVVEGLQKSGHQVTVITSTHGLLPGALEDRQVLRWLSIKGAGRFPAPKKALDKISDLLLFWRALRRVKPSVVYFWNLTGLTLQVVNLSRFLGYRCAFFLSDSSFTSWRTGAFLYRLSSSQHGGLLARSCARIFSHSRLMRGSPVIAGKPCHFASGFLADLAQRNEIHVAPGMWEIIHWGIDPAVFYPATSGSPWPPTRFLFLGQVIPQKGVHTLIEAFRLMFASDLNLPLTLSIVGGSSQPSYESEIRDRVRDYKLERHVTFVGKRPRVELAHIYGQHDVLLFPSEWEEPFAITPLEAMACGLPVIGTATGGSKEIFQNGKTALVFRAGDAESCVASIQRLRGDEDLFRRLVAEGRAKVYSDFTLEAMTHKIEQALSRLV